jgi:hypothetical protein
MRFCGLVQGACTDSCLFVEYTFTQRVQARSDPQFIHLFIIFFIFLRQFVAFIQFASRWCEEIPRENLRP